MLFLYVLLFIHALDGARCDDEIYSGSEMMLDRFNTIHQQFAELKEELGILNDFSNVQKVKVDPAAHLKKSSCDSEGGCMNNFVQDNTTSVFNWNKKLATDDSFPFRGASRKPNDKHFMVASVNKHHKRNEHSILTTDVPIKNTRQCVDFYYFMHSDDGCDVVRFSVTLKCTGYPDEAILKISGSKKKQWNYVLYDVNRPVGTKCQISWRAAKGLSEEGKVGIDDVNIHYEACPTKGRVFSTRLGCNFQNGFCLWKESSESGQLKWKRGTHKLISMDKQIMKKDSNDIYIKHIKSVVNSRTALMTSPFAFNSQPKCFSIKWIMVGRKPGRLTVSFITKNGTTVAWTGNMSAVKSTSCAPATWKWQTIDLPVKETFKVQIKYTSGNRTKFYVAISVINILDGECSVYNEPPPLPSNQCSVKESTCNMASQSTKKQDQANKEIFVTSSCVESYVPVFLLYVMCNFLRNTAISPK